MVYFFVTCTVCLARCVCRNFLGVGVSVREGYWRIGVRGLEGVCHQVGGANFTGMTQIKKTEMRNALKVTFFLTLSLLLLFLALPPFEFFTLLKFLSFF